MACVVRSVGHPVSQVGLSRETFPRQISQRGNWGGPRMQLLAPVVWNGPVSSSGLWQHCPGQPDPSGSSCSLGNSPLQIKTSTETQALDSSRAEANDTLGKLSQLEAHAGMAPVFM